MDLLRLALQWVSEAETKQAIMSTLAAAARSAPRALGTSAVRRTPGRRWICAITSEASANCGTARGVTRGNASTSPASREATCAAGSLIKRNVAFLILMAEALRYPSHFVNTTEDPLFQASSW